MVDSDEYRDYVIRDGEFVGAFEEMYRNCPDPWKLDQKSTLKEDAALLVLQRSDPEYERVLDIGCGKGKLFSRINATVGESSVGLDISPTAVSTASSRVPESEFVAADVPPLPFENDTFDLVVSSELLWYVLDDLNSLFGEVERVLSSGGRLLLVQQFYDESEQSYGNEVMETPDDLLKMVNFDLVERAHLSGDPAGNHSFLALFSV